MPSVERSKQDSSAWIGTSTGGALNAAAALEAGGFAGRLDLMISAGTVSRPAPPKVKPSVKEGDGRAGDVDGETLGEGESADDGDDDGDDGSSYYNREPRKSSTQTLAEFLATTGPEDIRPGPRRVSPSRKRAAPPKKNLPNFFRIGRGTKEKKLQQYFRTNIPLGASPVPPAGVLGVTAGGKKYVALQVPQSPRVSSDFQDRTHVSSSERDRYSVRLPGPELESASGNRPQPAAEPDRPVKVYTAQPGRGLTASRPAPFPPAKTPRWDTQASSYLPLFSASAISPDSVPERPSSSLTIGSSSSSLPSVTFPVPPSHPPSTPTISFGSENASADLLPEGQSRVQQFSVGAASSQSYTARGAASFPSDPANATTGSVSSGSSHSRRVGSLDRAIFDQLFTAAGEDDFAASASSKATIAMARSAAESPEIPAPARGASLLAAAGEQSVVSIAENDGEEDGNATLYHPEVTSSAGAPAASFSLSGSRHDSVSSDEQRTKKSVTFVGVDATLIPQLPGISSLPEIGPRLSAGLATAYPDMNAQCYDAVAGAPRKNSSLPGHAEMDQEYADRELATRLAMYRMTERGAQTSADARTPVAVRRLRNEDMPFAHRGRLLRSVGVSTDVARTGDIPQLRTRKSVRHMQVQTRPVTTAKTAVQTEGADLPASSAAEDAAVEATGPAAPACGDADIEPPFAAPGGDADIEPPTPQEAGGDANFELPAPQVAHFRLALADENLRRELAAARKLLEAETRSKAKVVASMEEARRQFDVLSARAYSKLKEILNQRGELEREVRVLRSRISDLALDGAFGGGPATSLPRERRALRPQVAAAAAAADARRA